MTRDPQTRKSFESQATLRDITLTVYKERDMGRENQHDPLRNEIDSTHVTPSQNTEPSELQSKFSVRNFSDFITRNKYIQSSVIIVTLLSGFPIIYAILHLLFGLSIVKIDSYTKNSEIDKNYVKRYTYDEKIKIKDEELSSLRHENSKIHQENLHLKEIIEPIRKIAADFYPHLEISVAVARLSQEIKELRKRVSEDDFHPLDENIKKEIISNLSSFYREHKNTIQPIDVSISLGNENRSLLRRELVDILIESGFEIGIQAHLLGHKDTEFPLGIGFNPNEENFVREFAKILNKFIKTNKYFNLARSKNHPTGKLSINIYHDPKFQSNGIVVFR